MRALALFFWLLAICLAVLIMRDQEAEAPAARAVPESSLALWQGEAAIVTATQPESPGPLPAEPAPVVPPLSAVASGCARLGIFPDQAWATSVAGIIAAAEAGQQPVVWRIQPVGRKGFYVVFDGMSSDALAVRMAQRRAGLARLVSAAVVPERCVGSAK